MEFKNVLLEKEERIAILTINRPKALNALIRIPYESRLRWKVRDDNTLCPHYNRSWRQGFVAELTSPICWNVPRRTEFGLLGREVSG